MKFRERTFYIGYHHLTYACFCFILLQIIFLICIQSLSQKAIAEKFQKEKSYIIHTIKSNLETLDYKDSREGIIKQLKHSIYPRVRNITRSLMVLPIWQLSPSTDNNDANSTNSTFYLTNYVSNPFLMKIDFPNQHLSIKIQFKVIPDIFWDSFMVSIFIMLAFIIAWAIFIYGFNLSFKTRILRGFLTRREDSLTENAPKDLTGELIYEIQALMDQKTLMLSALSHDLKTPLTELELKLYLLEDQELASNLLKLTNDITKIVQSSLQYAKGFGQVKKETADLNKVLNKLSIETTSPNQPVIFHDTKENFQYSIEPTLFKRMLINLIINAKNYANGCNISLHKNLDGKIEIIIEDSGPGVSEMQLSLLGKPFFRADTSRSRKTGGTGLGLAIVKQIAQTHSLMVTFKNKTNGGLKVTLTEF
ncbi:MAG: signal transduction histidine kinase [Francisellaceae bacterium]|jgi:signal transduction histidine kinase